MAKSKRTRFASDPNALLTTLVGVEVAVIVIVLLPVDTELRVYTPVEVGDTVMIPLAAELLAYTPVEVGDTVVPLVETDLPTTPVEVEDTVVSVTIVPLTSMRSA